MKKYNFDLKRKNCFFYLAFVLLMILSLLRIVYYFDNNKEDFHSDEVWSFGLSNSYYEPFIYQSADHSEFINNDHWFSGDRMKSYLTVDANHRFSYNSVIYNQVHDYHPPLYYLILHTICSFFPDKLSFWYGFVINIVSYVFLYILLYKVTYEISKSKIIGLICCLFYGFSAGAINTFVFVRMYAMLTTLGMFSVYLHLRLYKNGMSKSILLSLILVTVLGALTHHFYVPFAACMSACFCVYFLAKKQIKQLLIYSLVMLGSVALSVVLFPATIDHIFSGRINDPKYTPSWQLIMTINCMLRELFGFELPVILGFSVPAVLIKITVALIILSPCLYFLRGKNLIQKTSKTFKKIYEIIRKPDLILVAMFISVLGVIILTAATVSLISMGCLTDRYIFIIFPLVCIVFVCIMYGVIHKLLNRKILEKVVVAVVCTFFCVMSNTDFNTNLYLFQKPNDIIDAEELLNDTNCVFLTDEYWLLTCFSKEAINANSIYATTYNNLKDKIQSIPEPDSRDKTLYYLINDSCFENEESGNVVLRGKMPKTAIRSDYKADKISKDEFEIALLEKYTKCEYIGYDVIFERKFFIYQVN